jgi:hypothetical protein
VTQVDRGADVVVAFEQQHRAAGQPGPQRQRRTDLLDTALDVDDRLDACSASTATNIAPSQHFAIRTARRDADVAYLHYETLLALDGTSSPFASV